MRGLNNAPSGSKKMGKKILATVLYLPESENRPEIETEIVIVPPVQEADPELQLADGEAEGRDPPALSTSTVTYLVPRLVVARVLLSSETEAAAETVTVTVIGTGIEIETLDVLAMMTELVTEAVHAVADETEAEIEIGTEREAEALMYERTEAIESGRERGIVRRIRIESAKEAAVGIRTVIGREREVVLRVVDGILVGNRSLWDTG